MKLGKQTWLKIGPILMLGLFLRLFQLGQSSLWFDEVGTASAAIAPSLDKIFEIMKTHVMPMPLDLFVGWLVARACSSEFCLRLPSALWGTLTLLVVYILLARLASDRTALTGMIFLTLSPIHIYYSQEARAYAALVFFYLLGTVLVWDAMEQPSQNRRETLRRWARVAIVASIGGNFHIYVLLFFANGIFWLLYAPRTGLFPWKKVFGLTVCGLAAIALVLPGMLAFSPQQKFLGEVNPGMIIFSLVSGLGGYPNYFGESGLRLGWFVLFVSLFLVGLYRVFHTRQWQLTAWLFATISQICIILILDIFWKYWINPRQFLQFLPLTCFLAALGLLIPWETQELIHRRRKNWMLAAVLGLVVLVSLPAISGYYSQKKSLGREISQMVAQLWRQGEQILVIPPEYPLLYQYYLHQNGRDDIVGALIISEVNLDSLKTPINSNLLIAKPGLILSEEKGLLMAGYKRLTIPGEAPNLPSLWQK